MTDTDLRETALKLFVWINLESIACYYGGGSAIACAENVEQARALVIASYEETEEKDRPYHSTIESFAGEINATEPKVHDKPFGWFETREI